MPNDKLHHKLGAGSLLAIVLAVLFMASHAIGRFAHHAADAVVPGRVKHVLGYAPPPPPGLVFVTPSGNTVSGSAPVSPMCVMAEPVFGPTCVDAGANVLVGSIPGALAFGESDALDLTAQLVADGGVAIGAGNCTRRFHGADVSGTFQTAAGGTTDTSITADYGGIFQDAGCALAWDAGASGQLGSLNFTVSTGNVTNGGPCVYWGLSTQRCLQPSWGPSLTVDKVTPSQLNTTVASPTPLYLQGTHDIQPASATLMQLTGPATITLSSPGPCGGASSNCAQGTLAANSYTGGTYNLVLTTAAGVFTLTNAFLFQNLGAPSITKVYPDMGIAGTTLTAPGSYVGATTGNTTATVCGTAATLSAITSTIATIIAPANTASSTACSVVITNAAGTATASSAFTQMPAGLISNMDPSPCATCQGLGLTLNGSAVSGLIDWQRDPGGTTSANDATQATGANQPTGTTTNYNASGLTAITITGGTQFLLAGTFPATVAPIEAFIVADSPTTTGPYGLVAGQTAANFRAFIQNPGAGSQLVVNDGTGTAVSQAAGGIVPTTVYLADFVDDAASSKIFLNNSSVATGTISTGLVGIPSGQLGVGQLGGGGSSNNGRIAQIPIFNVDLSAPNRLIVYTYLKTKWHTP